MTSLALPLAARSANGLRRVAWIGIAIGLVAAWLALPPLSIRSWVPSLVLALIAVMLGLGVAMRGERRFGAFAIAAGVFGFGLAFLATLSGIGKLESVVVWSALFAATLRFATPLAFAALGGLFSERSGVVNIGLEGMMLMGAFFGIMGADKTNSWWLGLLIGIAAGGAAALVHAFFSIHLQADQIVGGTAINFLAVGLTGYLFIDIYGTEGTPTDIPSIPNVQARLRRRRAVPRRDLRAAEPDDLDRDPPRAAHVARHLQDAGRPADPRLRRASAGRGHRRDQRVRNPLRRSRHLGDAGRRGRRVPVDRLRQLVQREHDRRTVASSRSPH